MPALRPNDAPSGRSSVEASLAIYGTAFDEYRIIDQFLTIMFQGNRWWGITKHVGHLHSLRVWAVW